MKDISKALQQREIQFVLAWLLGGLAFRSIIAFWLYPGFDEAYYYLYSQHLDWSYFDHPLLVAFTTGFGVWLTGIVSQFTIRIGTLLLYTGSLLLLYLTSRRLFGLKAAQYTLAISSVIPIFFLAFGTMTLPDVPLIFFWTGTLYVAAWEFFGEKEYKPTPKLVLISILVGLTCLGKYHGFLLGFGLFCFVILSPRHRCVLISRWLGLGLLAFLVTLFPLWWWNWQHDWVSFGFQLSSRFEPETGVPKPGFSWLKVLLVWLMTVGYLCPTMGLPLWWISARSLYSQISHSIPKLHPKIQFSREFLEKQGLILAVSLPLTLGFTLLGGKEAILPGWPMPGFWGLTMLLGDRAVHWQQQSRRGLRRWLGGTAIFLTTLLILVLLHLNLGTLQKPSNFALFGGFIAPKQDPSRELIDIIQLRQGFLNNPSFYQALKDSDFVFSNAYYLGGYLGMAITPIQNIPITCFSKDMRGFATWSKPGEFVGQNGLYITLERFHEMPELTNEFSHYFRTFTEIGTIPLKRGGEITDVFHIYQAQTLLKPYPRSPVDALAS
ncbi:MAG: glycosyltransferase family 39 protein [Jaaginema sp. PMC 1079.18]|nr:glycosyltransferase family 39 protein [Jaaginema sp. PMC 1080.18]MEC4849781.1 glycosyltransferase family 39 protein [Jaaginema sp. PMC 1079.18]MEC4865706.1 glycosyltransferase family 39 protein [Jaaginema sp. PMC 1078.18]